MEVPAHAKINLTLEVLARRGDGYHEVKSILQTIDLADSVRFQPAPDLRVECDNPALRGEDNLVWRAAEALANLAGIRPRAHIFVEKRIPVGLGLGGGSSDAAAALVGLNRLWGLSLTRADLAKVAEGLGSDVPFFLWGGTALATGRGESIIPLPPLSAGFPVTLICPPDTIPDKTATLYSRLTPDHYSDGSITAQMRHSLVNGTFTPDMLYNAFEQVAVEAFPALELVHRQIDLLSLPRLHLSGAGPALFYAPSDRRQHQQISSALSDQGVKTYFAQAVAFDADAELPTS